MGYHLTISMLCPRMKKIIKRLTVSVLVVQSLSVWHFEEEDSRAGKSKERTKWIEEQRKRRDFEEKGNGRIVINNRIRGSRVAWGWERDNGHRLLLGGWMSILVLKLYISYEFSLSVKFCY